MWRVKEKYCTTTNKLSITIYLRSKSGKESNNYNRIQFKPKYWFDCLGVGCKQLKYVEPSKIILDIIDKQMETSYDTSFLYMMVAVRFSYAHLYQIKYWISIVDLHVNISPNNV